MMNNSIDISQNKAARLAGLTYLVVIITPLISLIFIDPIINVTGDLAATLINIIENETLYRIAITMDLLMYIGVTLLALTLYKVLKPINSFLAKLALFYRVTEAIIGIIAVLSYTVVLLILKAENFLIFDKSQLYALAEVVQNFYWQTTIFIFVFLAIGSILCFYLFLKSNYIPKALSIWGIISYSLVLIGALISLIFSGNIYMILGSQTILFEIVIGVWLLYKGIRN